MCHNLHLIIGNQQYQVISNGVYFVKRTYILFSSPKNKTVMVRKNHKHSSLKGQSRRTYFSKLDLIFGYAGILDLWVIIKCSLSFVFTVKSRILQTIIMCPKIVSVCIYAKNVTYVWTLFSIRFVFTIDHPPCVINFFSYSSRQPFSMYIFFTLQEVKRIIGLQGID